MKEHIDMTTAYEYFVGSTAENKMQFIHLNENKTQSNQYIMKSIDFIISSRAKIIETLILDRGSGI